MSTGELASEEVVPLSAVRPKGDAWKPTAIGATLAAFVFAGGIGWLARERQRTQGNVAALQSKLKAQLADQEALQRRLYEQNRDLATLNTRVRERDTKVNALLTKLTATEKALALAVKERDEWRARASASPTAPVLVVPTASLAEKPQEDPPRMTRRSSSSSGSRRSSSSRRRRIRRRTPETSATTALTETPRRKATKSSRRRSSEEAAPRRARSRSKARATHRED